MAKTIRALDTISGQIGEVPEVYLTLPTLGDHLVRAEDGAKNYEPTMYKPTDAKGYKAKKENASKVVEVEPEPDQTPLEDEIK